MKQLSFPYIVGLFVFVAVLCNVTFVKAAKDDNTSNQRLVDIRNEMDTLKQDKGKLKNKKSKLEKKIRNQEDLLLDLSSKIQGNELNQKHLEIQITELSEKEKVLNLSFNEKKADIESLIFAMIRLKSVPTEIMLLQPDGLLAAAQGSMIMGGVLPNVEQELTNLNNELIALSQLQLDIEKQKSYAKNVRTDLSQDHNELMSLIEQRKTDLYNTNKNLHRHQMTLSKLSREAETVEDLLSKITQLSNIPKPVMAPRAIKVSRQERIQKKKRAESRMNNVAKASFVSKVPYTHTVYNLEPGMPVVGKVNINYGQVDDIGAKSQGWTITTQKNAIVTAPFTGTVKYTGAFKRYGQIILIEHDKNYFSLIGGVSEIFVLPETRIERGAPVGKMGSVTNNSGEMGLYYEVRYKGKPVDPKRLLSSRKL